MAFKRLWKNEYFQTAITIVLVVVVVLGIWYGSQMILRTDYPALAVASGSMCTLPGPYCDGWSHPFARTLHVGDLIIVQGVPTSDIHAAPYPDGDIIVYRSPYTNELIVHRAIKEEVVGNVTYFTTQGDGNPGADSPFPADLVVGKVVMRIPWIGHLALFMRNSAGIFIIVILIVVLVIVEFLIPAFGKKKGGEPEQEPKPPEPPSGVSV